MVCIAPFPSASSLTAQFLDVESGAGIGTLPGIPVPLSVGVGGVNRQQVVRVRFVVDPVDGQALPPANVGPVEGPVEAVGGIPLEEPLCEIEVLHGAHVPHFDLPLLGVSLLLRQQIHLHIVPCSFRGQPHVSFPRLLQVRQAIALRLQRLAGVHRRLVRSPHAQRLPNPSRRFLDDVPHSPEDRVLADCASSPCRREAGLRAIPRWQQSGPPDHCRSSHIAPLCVVFFYPRVRQRSVHVVQARLVGVPEECSLRRVDELHAGKPGLECSVAQHRRPSSAAVRASADACSLEVDKRHVLNDHPSARVLIPREQEPSFHGPAHLLERPKTVFESSERLAEG
eukprot:3114816-Rhodomonas_salina.3